MNSEKMKAAETLIHLLFAYSSLFILILQSQSQRCVANAQPNCTASACGIIPNISYPFRLKGDPDYCGDPGGELACENNVLYLKSHKYYVKAINYTSTTIRVVDASINGDTCSFPTFSPHSRGGLRFVDPSFWVNGDNSPINIMSCSHPLKNSSPFTNITHCQNSNSSNSRFTYIKISSMMAFDVPETCRVDAMAPTSWKGFKDLNNVSLEEIHRSLLYGFKLEFCGGCGASYSYPAWSSVSFPY